ncbi:hypothetical protein ABTF26_19460, partial [Acinetobacter baumannii]
MMMAAEQTLDMRMTADHSGEPIGAAARQLVERLDPGQERRMVHKEEGRKIAFGGELIVEPSGALGTDLTVGMARDDRIEADE